MEFSRDALKGRLEVRQPNYFGQEGSKCWYVLQLGKSTLAEVPDDFGDSLVFGEICFPLWGFGWEFCDLFSQPRNLEVHIALQEGCGQLAVVLLASQSPVSQLEVPTVGGKKMVVRMRKINQKNTTRLMGQGEFLSY